MHVGDACNSNTQWLVDGVGFRTGVLVCGLSRCPSQHKKIKKVCAPALSLGPLPPTKKQNNSAHSLDCSTPEHKKKQKRSARLLRTPSTKTNSTSLLARSPPPSPNTKKSEKVRSLACLLARPPQRPTKKKPASLQLDPDVDPLSTKNHLSACFLA